MSEPWSRLLSWFRRPRIHVCGLLATYDIKEFPTPDDDNWMAMDFVAIRELIGARDDMSVWFCGTPIRRENGLLIENPYCDHIPTSFEKLVAGDPQELALGFLIGVTKKASMLSARDTLVIVLIGHGEKDDTLTVGGNGRQNFEIRRETLEKCLLHAKGRVLVMIRACYLVNWKSPHWTLIATTPGEETPSIAVSDSGECRGGFFTTALLTSGFTIIRSPCPCAMDNRGFWNPQKDHGFGPGQMDHSVPRRNLQEVMNWIRRFRNNIGRVHTSADITFQPCRDGTHRLPFASLIPATTPLHRLKCVPPSPPSNHASVCSASMHARFPDISSLPIVPERTPRKLSEEEEAELRALAANLLRFMPPSIPSEIFVTGCCWRLIRGPAINAKPLSDVERSKLFANLKNRIRKRELALATAKNLGWRKGIREVGMPVGKQTQMSPMRRLQREAEASGCLVSILHIPTDHSPWGDAAGWLARVWEAEGRPVVSPDDWAMAVEQGSAILEDSS